MTLMLVLECTLVEKGHHSGVGPKGHVRYKGVGVGKDHGAAYKKGHCKDA